MDCDILVIGCGAAGLSAAGYGARAGRSVIAIDALAPGGQLLYIDEIENYANLIFVGFFPFFSIPQNNIVQRQIERPA